MPYKTLFPGQEKNEKIILILRRHFFVFIKTLLMYIILVFLPLLIRYLFNNYTTIVLSETARVGIGLVLSLYYIFIVTFFYRAWLDHYLDVWVVTSERIVDIEQKGLFSRQISAQRLYRIQDVTADVKGILPTLLHYGNVHVQTAGTEQRFIFKQIPNPYEVTKKITMLVNWKKDEMKKEEVRS